MFEFLFLIALSISFANGQGKKYIKTSPNMIFVARKKIMLAENHDIMSSNHTQTVRGVFLVNKQFQHLKCLLKNETRQLFKSFII